LTSFSSGGMLNKRWNLNDTVLNDCVSSSELNGKILLITRLTIIYSDVNLIFVHLSLQVMCYFLIEQVGLAVTPRFVFRGDLIWISAEVSLGFLSLYRDITRQYLSQAKTASFQILSNLLHIYHPTFLRYIVCNTESVVK
jgi:hypothetical protein